MLRSKARLIVTALVLMLVLAGCSQTAPGDVSFEFNEHVYPCFLDACRSEDYREGWFNLVDALQEGDDTFECPSEEVYEFCMDEVTHNQLYPVACLQITGKSTDGSVPYENGTGRIYYTKSKEDFLERQKKFRSDVEEIMDEYIRPGYSDYEKCLVLYDYIVSNYEYDYDGTLDRSEDGSVCACIKYKKGECGDFSAWYGYLLLQSGVDAIPMSNWGHDDEVGSHAWTFVEINGKGYHIDPTWGLKSDLSQEYFILDYFMITDDDREADGYPADLMEVYLIPESYTKDCKAYVFTADDDTYRFPKESECDRYDTDKNVVYYHNYAIDSEEHEFRYE